MSTSVHMSVVPAPKRRAERRGLRSEAGLEQVEACMDRLAVGERLDRLGSIAREHLSTGGRRIRARLALSAGESLGLSRDELTAWAASVEMLHNATLVHDDLQDGDEMRRGQLAVWRAHGVAQAINTGDLMLMLPYTAVDEVPAPDGVKWRLCKALASHSEAVVRGQAAEMDLMPRERFDWASYSDSVRGKTAALFALPVYGAALIAGRSDAHAQALAAEFAEIGLLYQIQDDVVDLYGAKGRGENGSDLKEGKVSAFVVEHLRNHPHDREPLLRLLRMPRAETPDALVAETIERFRTCGTLASVWDRLGAIEERIDSSEVLSLEPKLHAVAMDLVALALVPILHTDPHHGLEVR